MTIRALYPAMKPSLNLDFANSRRLDPRVTFTRNSVGTYVDQSGVLRTAGVNEPRFDHDPATGESLGLLVEESRTNLLLQSEDFSTTWSRTGLQAFGSGSIANAIISPNGTLTADFIAEDALVSAQFAVYQVATTVSAGSTVTFSVYLKAGARTFARLIVYDNANTNNNFSRFFDLTTGTAGASVVNGTGVQNNASITPAGNGWFRCTITGSVPTATTYQTRINIATDINTATYTGDGTSGIYLWGAQIEAGAFPTSYIKTEGTTVTRQGDVAQMTGTNFSSWYNQSEGTVFSDVAVQSLAVGNSTWSIGDGALAFGSRNSFYSASTAATGVWGVLVGVSGVSQIGTSAYTGAFTPEAPLKTAFGFAYNNMLGAGAGSIGFVDTSCIVPTGSFSLSLGSFASGWSGAGVVGVARIRRFAFFPQRLPDATLQALTAG